MPRFVSTVPDKLVIRGGRLAMVDGTSVTEYLKAQGYKEGDLVNIMKRPDMVKFDQEIKSARWGWCC